MSLAMYKSIPNIEMRYQALIKKELFLQKRIQSFNLISSEQISQKAIVKEGNPNKLSRNYSLFIRSQYKISSRS